MEKWIKSPWFTRVVSLFLAILLYLSVTTDDSTLDGSDNTIFPEISSDSETMQNVPLQVELDEEKYVVRGVPDSVEVAIDGPISVVTQTVIQRNFDIFIDLNGLGPGTHQVEVQHQGMSSKLQIYIKPQTVQVTIEERATVNKQVEIEFVGQNGTDGSEVFAEEPVASPEEVEITGPKSEVSRIGIVKAIVSFEELAEEGIVRSVPVKVYDSQGNELNVFINPSTVTIEADVSMEDKRLPLTYETFGELNDDLVLKAINIKPATATLYGTEEDLSKINQLQPVRVDLSTITESTTLEKEIIVPSSVRRINPVDVQIDIEVEQAKEKQLTDLEVGVENLGEGKEITFIEPEEPLINVTAKGSSEAIDALTNEDIRAWIDVSEYVEGEFIADVQLEGPEGIQLRTDTETVRVRIE